MKDKKEEKKPDEIEKKPDKPWLFQAGQSGNPKGRAKGSTNSNADILRKAIAAALDKDNNLDTLISALVYRAIAGDNQATLILFERYAGKPIQPEPEQENKAISVNVVFGAPPDGDDDGEDLDDDMYEDLDSKTNP
jgi:hypothetical protein